MDWYSGAIIADAREIHPLYHPEPSSNDPDPSPIRLDIPLYKGLICYVNVASREDDQLDVNILWRFSALRPNAPKVYPNKQAARDALTVHTHHHKYTTPNNETALLQIPATKDKPHYLLFVTTKEYFRDW